MRAKIALRRTETQHAAAAGHLPMCRSLLAPWPQCELGCECVMGNLCRGTSKPDRKHRDHRGSVCYTLQFNIGDPCALAEVAAVAAA